MGRTPEDKFGTVSKQKNKYSLRHKIAGTGKKKEQQGIIGQGEVKPRGKAREGVPLRDSRQNQGMGPSTYGGAAAIRKCKTDIATAAPREETAKERRVWKKWMM